MLFRSDRLQQRAQTWLNDHWQLVAAVLGTVIVIAIGYATMRERSRQRAAE